MIVYCNLVWYVLKHLGMFTSSSAIETSGSLLGLGLGTSASQHPIEPSSRHVILLAKVGVGPAANSRAQALDEMLGGEPLE